MSQLSNIKFKGKIIMNPKIKSTLWLMHYVEKMKGVFRFGSPSKIKTFENKIEVCDLMELS